MARKAVLNEKIPHIDSTVFPHISVSIGMATVEFPLHNALTLPAKTEEMPMSHTELHPEILLEMADQNLYRAKQNGRNRIY